VLKRTIRVAIGPSSRELAKEEQELSRQVDAMMSEWMSLSEELAGASPEAAS
jgi:hypothetical protein